MIQLGRGSTLTKQTTHDKLSNKLQENLTNNHFSPNAISHKELNALLTKAKKEISNLETSWEHEINENKEFNDLITEWTEISHKILVTLNKKDKFSTKNRQPQSLLAFGAMGAHIKMALHALKATELDKEI